MFLKSLTIKGFKSFADKTVLDFEPGVTVVVGPNGSGKSNLVDAVAWVLGAQGPRTLRGGKMDDVIFAGTPQRPALGRAEVSLTIDNTAALLPIEFDEVTVTRTLFRNGDSEYQLNGVPCRLLDITELLSDTGIGRQQHVIVGQGQLDSVLNSRPEDRRAVVEEAAGVLKFRKRREKAERRLEATEGNLLRLNDLLREVRRQLRPLERQADAARRHDDVEAERRAIRVHLAGREIAALEQRIERIRARRLELTSGEDTLRARLRTLDDAIADAEQSLVSAGDDELADALLRVEALRERGRGLRALAVERERGYERQLAAAADSGVVETLVADADAMRRELEALGAERDALEGGMAPDFRAELTAAEAAVRDAERIAARTRARADALAARLSASAVGARLSGIAGVVGALVDELEIEPGAEAAVSAALGDALHAIVVDGNTAARQAMERLVAGDVSSFLLVLSSMPAAADGVGAREVVGTRPVVALVRSRRPELGAIVARLLADVVLYEGDWRDAFGLAAEHPDLVIVTRDGARIGGARPWRVGRPIEATRGAVEAAATDAAAAESELARAEQRHREIRALEEERRSLELKAVGLDARRASLERRLGEVDVRLAARDESAHAEARRQRTALVHRLEACRGVGARLAAHAELVDHLHARLSEHRRRQSEVARASAAALDARRVERRSREAELTETRELAGRAEIEETETKLRLEAAHERLRVEFDCEPVTALEAPAPEVPEGVTLAGRARELERELKLMGPINPLALAEHEALQERHTFLQAQLDDVKESRRELQRVVRAIDREIVSVFEGAFSDVQQHFSALFTTLFPGGSGRITLSDPDDPLHTGIELEARPSGKNVRRLSLLSGGERSLTALAFLFAVFRARPSPFYLLDEVEAALDDVNLHRFLDLVHEFRDEAQLLIVSHQKRTMEAADLLYGVSMPPGGSSRVVSQRLDDTLVLD